MDRGGREMDEKSVTDGGKRSQVTRTYPSLLGSSNLSKQIVASIVSKSVKSNHLLFSL